MLHDPAKTYEHRDSSESHLARPNTGPTVQETTWLAYLYAAGRLASSTSSDVTGILNTPESSGTHCNANCARRASAPHSVQGTRHRASSEAHPSVSRTLTRAFGPSPSASGHSPEPPGSTEHLRVFTERLRAFTGGSLLHGPGLSRPTAGLPRPKARPAARWDDFGCPTASLFATEHLRTLTEPPGSTGTPSGDPLKPALSKLAVMRR